MIKQHFDTCVESQVFARLETVCISSLNLYVHLRLFVKCSTTAHCSCDEWLSEIVKFSDDATPRYQMYNYCPCLNYRNLYFAIVRVRFSTCAVGNTYYTYTSLLVLLPVRESAIWIDFSSRDHVSFFIARPSPWHPSYSTDVPCLPNNLEIHIRYHLVRNLMRGWRCYWSRPILLQFANETGR